MWQRETYCRHHPTPKLGQIEVKQNKVQTIKTYTNLLKQAKLIRSIQIYGLLYNKHKRISNLVLA